MNSPPIIKREPIQILAQKTVVTDPKDSRKDSRNSIRPLLEEAGYTFDYERYSRTLRVRDGVNTEVLRIVGVKGIEDFARFSIITVLFNI